MPLKRNYNLPAVDIDILINDSCEELNEKNITNSAKRKKKGNS